MDEIQHALYEKNKELAEKNEIIERLKKMIQKSLRFQMKSCN